MHNVQPSWGDGAATETEIVVAELKYNAEAFRKTFGPRVTCEGDGTVSEEMRARVTTPVSNCSMVDISVAIRENSARVFDNDRKIIRQLLGEPTNG